MKERSGDLLAITILLLFAVVVITFGFGYRVGSDVATEQLTSVETAGVTLTTCVSSLERALDYMLVADTDYHEYEAMTSEWRALIDAGGSQ